MKVDLPHGITCVINIHMRVSREKTCCLDSEPYCVVISCELSSYVLFHSLLLLIYILNVMSIHEIYGEYHKMQENLGFYSDACRKNNVNYCKKRLCNKIRPEVLVQICQECG